MPFCPHCRNRVGDVDTLCRTCGQAIQPDAGAKRQGFPVVLWVALGAGCLVVGVAVAGILAAILIPNFVDALHKAKQKRTVADLQATSSMLMSYVTDHEVFPEVETIQDLEAVLTAEYGGDPIAVVDGWQNPFRYECWREGGSGPGCDHFRLGSGGRDGIFEHESLADYTEETFSHLEYDRDVVAADGLLLQYPIRSPPAEAPSTP